MQTDDAHVLQIENLFCLGSPLAVFLALRGMRPHGNASQEILLPKSKCHRIFNIYHPADPVVSGRYNSGQMIKGAEGIIMNKWNKVKRSKLLKGKLQRDNTIAFSFILLFVDVFIMFFFLQIMLSKHETLTSFFCWKPWTFSNLPVYSFPHAHCFSCRRIA